MSLRSTRPMPRVRRAALETLEPRLLLSSTWQNVKIEGGGFVTGLAASTTGSAIYARTDVGGAFRWDAVNTEWDTITAAMPADASNRGDYYGIGSLAVDPNDANRVFIAAGKFTYSSSGLFVSSNANAATPTWTTIDATMKVNGNGGGRQRGERLVVDPNNSNTLYFGAYNISGGGSGLRKYTYNGSAWTGSTIATPAIGDANLGITFVAADKNAGSTILYIGVYSATAGAGGVFVSTNGGTSWTEITDASGGTIDKAARGEVAADGTLWITHDGGVARLARGSTTYTTHTPLAGIAYNALAVDPNAAGTVMVGEANGSDRMWRTSNGGTSWVQVNRNFIAKEPDGTASATRGNVDNIADLLITPGNSLEVWGSDFLGVFRTQGITNDTSASTWYSLQRNMEEVVPLVLVSSPTGAPLLSGNADVNGYVHVNPDVRPTPTEKFETPPYLSTTGLDFSEASPNVWARVGDRFYQPGGDNDRVGGFSIDGGLTWGSFGQLDNHTVTNSNTTGWVTYDVAPYLAAMKAAGINTVTLVLAGSNSSQNQAYLRFSSKEGGNGPELLLNGSTTLGASADATVKKGSTTTNYGADTDLQVQNYYDQNSYTRKVFLKFDLSGVSSITSATLRLYRLAHATDTSTYNTYIQATPTTGWVEGNGGTDNNPAGEITWANMPTNLYTTPSGATGGRIAVSATAPSTFVWAAENGAVWFTKDRGVTWTRSTLAGAAFSLNTLTQFEQMKLNLAADRVNGHFYAYSQSGGGTIYRSTDGGATWASLVASVGTPAQYKLETVPGQAGGVWLMGSNWNVASSFRYWNGTSMVTVPGISGAVDYSFGKSAPGRTNPTVFVRKSNGQYWYSVDATAGGSTWQQIAVPSLNNNANILEADRQTFGRVYVAQGGSGISYVDASAVVTWDGGTGGTGSSWNTAANWNPDTLPATWAVVTFTDAGLTAGKIISLDANQTVNSIDIGTITGFTLGSGTTYALSLVDLQRDDVAGTEANHTIVAPVTLLGDGTWEINGSGAMVVSGGVAGAFGLTKTGTGQLDLGTTSYTGDTTILAGTLRAIAAGTIKGNLVVGGGTGSATFNGSGQSDAIANAKNVTVLANGTVNLGSSENINALTVSGGTFNTNYSYVNGSITMTGGVIGGSGAVYGTHTSVTTLASAVTALWSVSNSINGYANSTFNIADGSAVVDFKATGALIAGGSGYTLSKTGAGLMMLTGSSSQANGNFNLSNGALLVNNASGSGTGRSAVNVSATAANATLGGTGTIGGVSGYTAANVALTGSASYTATLAPGSVNETTGAHVIGTLTVGSATQANHVTFNGYSRLAIAVSGSSNDRLTINGNLTIGANTTLAVTGTPTAASYTLASWTGTRSGSFATVTGVPAGYSVVYSANSITLVQDTGLTSTSGKKSRRSSPAFTTYASTFSDTSISDASPKKKELLASK